MHRPRMLGLAKGAAVAAAVLVLSAGCAGDGGDEPEENGEAFAELDGQEIADAAEEDMRSLEAMRYAGSLTSDGAEISLDIQSNTDGDCTGNIEVAGGSVDVLSTGGDSWFRADDAFWETNAPAEAAQIIALVGDSWVVDSGEEFSQFCDLDQFRDSLFDETDGGKHTYTNKGTDEIGGEAVVEVESKDDEGTSTGYILAEGKHYLVRIVSTDADKPGEVSLSAFDEEFTVEAPAADEIIDLDEL